jgi:hypothetical protein
MADSRDALIHAFPDLSSYRAYQTLAACHHSLLQAYSVLTGQDQIGTVESLPKKDRPLRDQDELGDNFDYALKIAVPSDHDYNIALEIQAARRIRAFLTKKPNRQVAASTGAAGVEETSIPTLECACCYDDHAADRMVSCDGEVEHVCTPESHHSLPGHQSTSPAYEKANTRFILTVLLLRLRSEAGGDADLNLAL